MLHDSTSYEKFRPSYPPELFAPLAARLAPLGDAALTVDLGTGTGLAIRAMAKAGVPGRFVGVDPDPAMLARASAPGARVSWIAAPAEATGLQSGVANALVLASCYHWLDRPRANAELLRLAAPGAWIQVFEYQFPRCADAPELSEWIRRQFNLVWRLENQKPRGTIRELLGGLLSPAGETFDLARVSGLGSFSQDMSVDELQGLIFSQARALSHLGRLALADRTAHQMTTLQKLREFYQGREKLPLEFKIAGVLFRTSNP